MAANSGLLWLQIASLSIALDAVVCGAMSTPQSAARLAMAIDHRATAVSRVAERITPHACHTIPTSSLHHNKTGVRSLIVGHNDVFNELNEREFTIEVHTTPGWDTAEQNDIQLYFRQPPKFGSERGVEITVSFAMRTVSVSMADGRAIDKKTFQGWQNLLPDTEGIISLECSNPALAGGRNCKVAVNNIVWDVTRHFSNVTEHIYTSDGTNVMKVSNGNAVREVVVCIGEKDVHTHSAPASPVNNVSLSMVADAHDKEPSVSTVPAFRWSSAEADPASVRKLVSGDAAGSMRPSMLRHK